MMSGYELRALAGGEFVFKLKARNRHVVLTSRRYKSREAALSGIESVYEHGVAASRFVRRVSADGLPYFVLVALNGQIIARSETYSSTGAMENGISALMRMAATPQPAADVS